MLTDLLARARSFLSGRAPASDPATDAVKHDRYEAELWQQLLTEAPVLQDLVDELGQTFDYTDDLIRDTVMQMWQGDPVVRQAGEMDSSRLVNHAVATDLATSPELAEARTYTVHDKYGAAMAAVGISGKVKDHLGAHQAKVDEAAQQAEEARQAEQEAAEAAQQAADAAEQAQQELEQLPPAEDGTPADDGGAAAAAAEALANAVAELEAAAAASDTAQAQVQAAAQQARAQLQTSVAEGLSEAKEELAEEAELFAAWGIDPGQLERMDFTQRAALAERLRSTSLSKYAKLIGRFRLMAAAQRTKKVEVGRDEVVGVELSGDVDRVVASEWLNLRHPKLRLTFLSRLAEGQLMSRQFEGTERVGNGAIICAIDSSGSMRGERDAWSKAMALALLDEARRLKRDFVGIIFADASRCRTFRFPAGRGDVEDIIEFVTLFYSGGTNFERPLTDATDVLEAEFNERGKAKGDIVLITDGECSVSTDWMHGHLARKDRLGFRTFGICVGRRPGSTLDALSDNVRAVTDFADVDQVEDIFRVLS